MKKRISFVTAAVCFSLSVLHAQENKVVSAKMHLDEYTQDPKDSSALHDAKDAIDLAAANDKTKDEPKMWLYRGYVYRAVFERNLAVALQKLMPQGNVKPTVQDVMKYRGQAYSSVDTTAICIAAFSYMRVIQLEPTKAYADEAKQLLPVCAGHIENQATADYGAQKYPIALAMFEKALSIGYIQGLKDTSDYMEQNIQNIALTADKIHDNATAITYYMKLIALKVGGSQPYLSLINDYNGMKDTANANATLRKGRQDYPQDVNLLIAETNYYLHTNKTDQAIGNLQKTIDRLNEQNRPEDKGLTSNLYFVLANTFDRLANPKDDSGHAMPRPANYEDLYGKAETNYMKAVTLTPDNFDEEYDFGALYNNRASELNKQADEVPPTDNSGKYDKLTAQAKGYLTKAQPYLEKAHSLNITDKATRLALKQIYAATGQTDKIKDLNDGK